MDAERRGTDVRVLSAAAFLTSGVLWRADAGEHGLRPALVVRTCEQGHGADYPSVCIDAKPVEHRATAWTMWLHESTGYLNYGGGQWQATGLDLRGVGDRDPSLVRHCNGNGDPNITWPGRDGPLTSVRFARFRDGIDDHDYIWLLTDMDPKHDLLRELRAAGRAAHATLESIQGRRSALAAAIERGIRR